MTPKQIRMQEVQDAADELDIILEFIHGEEPPTQLPNHYGNGRPDEREEEEEHHVSKT